MTEAYNRIKLTESGRSECAKHQSKKECNMLEKLKEDYVSGLGYN